MRRDAMVLGILLSAAAAIRASEVPNLAGSWTLASIDVGRGAQPVLPGYVMNIQQTGNVITFDSPATATRRAVTTLTIDPLKSTTDKKGVAVAVRIENQTLIVEEKRPGGCQWFRYSDSGRREEMVMPDNPANCVPRVLRSTYRVSADGATLEVTKLKTPTVRTFSTVAGGSTDDEVRSLAVRDGRWVFKRQ